MLLARYSTLPPAESQDTIGAAAEAETPELLHGVRGALQLLPSLV